MRTWIYGSEEESLLYTGTCNSIASLYVSAFLTSNVFPIPAAFTASFMNATWFRNIASLSIVLGGRRV